MKQLADSCRPIFIFILSKISYKQQEYRYNYGYGGNPND